MPYDHEINFNESFIPKIRIIYPLSPNEWKGTKDFLNENLQFSEIHPSNYPQVSLYFFIKKKKMKTYTLVRTTATLMSTLFIMSTLPSSQTSSTNYKG